VKLLPAAAAASCEARKRERQVQSGAEVRRIGDGARNVVCLSLQVYHYRRHRCVIILLFPFFFFCEIQISFLNGL
jgi:hypothetical protein